VAWSTLEPLIFVRTFNLTFKPYDVAEGVLNMNFEDEGMRSMVAFNFSNLVYREESTHNPIRDHIPDYYLPLYVEQELIRPSDLVISLAFKFYGI